MSSGVIGSLTICRKAGKLKLGLEKVRDACADRSAKAVLAAADISEKSLKEIKFFCGKYNVPLYRLEISKDDTGKALGKAAGVLAVCDDGFAGSISRSLERINTGTDNCNREEF